VKDTFTTCWTKCSKADIVFGEQSTKMDLIVKLHTNSPLMLTQNLSVQEGVANGTQVTFEQLI
jgi:hypothetical protein